MGVLTRDVRGFVRQSIVPADIVTFFLSFPSFHLFQLRVPFLLLINFFIRLLPPVLKWLKAKEKVVASFALL